MNIDLKKDTYSIGTVAALLGISSDTLRHYEKKGLITSGKLGNGYRYYTNEDLRNLLSVLYYRKMDLSLNHISLLLKNSSTSSQVEELLDRRILEEEETILRHRQNIARLKLSKLQNRRTDLYRKGFSIQPFPKSYIIDECSSSQEIILRWFQRAQETPGLDMAYFYDEYSCSGTDAPASYTRSRLLLYTEAVPALSKNFDLTKYPQTSDMDCVCHSFTAASELRPSGQIRAMAQWAREQGYAVKGTCFATDLASGESSAEKTYDVELYLPVTKR